MQLKEVFLTWLPWLQPSPQPDQPETETEAVSDRPSPPVVVAASYTTNRSKKLPGRRSSAGPR